MKQHEFGTWLRNVLEPQKFKDFCPNAICVETSDEVTKVVTGVSFRDSLIDAAIERGADTIFVHHAHGFWNNEPRLPIGTFGKKIGKLYKHGISLYGFHLPLDAHAEIGNNALIAQALNATVTQSFIRAGERDIAYIADFADAISQSEFMERVNKAMPHGANSAFMYGTNEIKRVAICSGSASSDIPEGFALGADAFITGEIKETTPIVAEENAWNVVACGHHRTEVFGVRAMAEKIQRELGISAEFVDIDNPI